MKVSRIIAASALMLAAASSAQAQTVNCDGATAAALSNGDCKVTHTVNATVGFAARLTLTSATTTLTAPVALNFGNPAGVDTDNALTIEVSSNVAYSLTASAPANFTGGSGNKPSSDLKISVDNAPAAAIGLIGSSASPTATTVYGIGYNTIYNWLIDTPGSYQLAISYTLTSP